MLQIFDEIFLKQFDRMDKCNTVTLKMSSNVLLGNPFIPINPTKKSKNRKIHTWGGAFPVPPYTRTTSYQQIASKKISIIYYNII